MKNKFYITTPIYYVNAKPHIGHAYTTIAADVLARFHKSQGEDVFFLTGTDEHGLKIQKVAEKAGKNPQKFVDEIAEEFKILWDKLNIKYDNFIRTTDENHKKAVQKVLQILYDKGAIYKGEYEGLYCVGCEQYKNESDLVNGKCPEHDMAPEKIKEECYMLKMTEKQNELIKKIESDEFKIAPEKYKNEILSFLKNQKLNDISVSRKNVKWGVPLPFEPKQTAYVWVDAFLNYLTGLGWQGDPASLPKQWPVDVQLIGKDILRVHATIWPIILMHLGIELPNMIFTHGYLLSGSRKMSKTLGNAITIEEILEKFGVDGTRYLLMSAGTFGDDVDITMERLTEKYNADLANGIGNLTSRIVTLYSKTDSVFNLNRNYSFFYSEHHKTGTYFENCRIDLIINEIMSRVKDLDREIEKVKPWKLAEADTNKFIEEMGNLVQKLNEISVKITPFMPETSEKIKTALETKKVEPLFQRIK